MRKTAQLLLAVSLFSYPFFSVSSFAQGGVVQEHSSSSSTVNMGEVKGFAFKYKERFRNYSEQITTGETKGWLTAAKATEFRTKLQDLKVQEAAAGKNGYPKADIDALDKVVTKFNQDLSDAEQTKPAATAK
jgi:hypothetical protein